MRIAKTLSITLPPELLAIAEKLAQKEHRTKSELIREALRHYIHEREWQTSRSRAVIRARIMGITSEEDVDRIVQEHRHGKKSLK
jgi:CopG family transcriptional regulator / antitoxin EndoAI